jgi:N-methylhydantoinase B
VPTNFDCFELEALRVRMKSILEIMACPFGDKWEIACALLDSKGDLVDAYGKNPLHFTALEASVKSLRKYLTPKHGEVFITNDPTGGNTRLCDLVFVQGAFGRQQANDLRFHLVLQITIPDLLNKKLKKIATSMEEEGYRIPPTPLDQQGQVNQALVEYLCQSGTDRDEFMRLLVVVKEALRDGVSRAVVLEQSVGSDSLQKGIKELRNYSEAAMRKALHEIPDGEYVAHDFLDNDGVDKQAFRVQARLSVQGENVLIGFAGTSKQCKGPFNCNHAMTLGACFWVLRSLAKSEIPVNSGAFKAFSIEAPEGSLVNALPPAPLLGGYYETTRRIVDVLFACLSKALPLEMPAANGGSSNPILMQFENSFHVDTLASGGGASRDGAGSVGVSTSLHNSISTSVEELERKFPVQVIHCRIRDSSGGSGKMMGGDGLTRGYKFLAPATLTLLADRRDFKNHGVFGGSSGLAGETVICRVGEKKKMHNEKKVIEVAAGDTLTINAPGGGGWGKEVAPQD